NDFGEFSRSLAGLLVAGHFELLLMEIRHRLQVNLLAIATLDLIERFALIDRQNVDDIRMSLNENLAHVALDNFALDFAQDFIRHRDLALDEAFAFAMAAGFAERT